MVHRAATNGLPNHWRVCVMHCLYMSDQLPRPEPTCAHRSVLVMRQLHHGVSGGGRRPCMIWRWSALTGRHANVRVWTTLNLSRRQDLRNITHGLAVPMVRILIASGVDAKLGYQACAQGQPRRAGQDRGKLSVVCGFVDVAGQYCRL